MGKTTEKPLTVKQDQFCQEYLIDLNATQAAIRAGYSPHRAHVTGCRLLTIGKVAAKLAELKAIRQQRTEVTQDKVVRELARIAFVDMGDYLDIDENGNVTLDFSKIPEGGTRAIKKLRQKVALIGDEESGYPLQDTEFELADKLRALDMLMKHLGAYATEVKQVEHSGTVQMEDGMVNRIMAILTEAQQRDEGS